MIDLTDFASRANIGLGLALIVILLMYLAFGKLDRELKSGSRSKSK